MDFSSFVLGALVVAVFWLFFRTRNNISTKSQELVNTEFDDSAFHDSAPGSDARVAMLFPIFVIFKKDLKTNLIKDLEADEVEFEYFSITCMLFMIMNYTDASKSQKESLYQRFLDAALLELSALKQQYDFDTMSVEFSVSNLESFEHLTAAFMALEEASSKESKTGYSESDFQKNARELIEYFEGKVNVESGAWERAVKSMLLMRKLGELCEAVAITASKFK